MNHHQGVLIVGAGASGLTAALSLTLQGVPCRIVSRDAPLPDWESRALGTHARTSEIFERLGVLDAQLTLGRPVRGFCFYAHGKRIGKLTLDGLDVPYPYIVMLEQALIEKTLLERLEGLGIAVERGWELTGLDQNDEGVSARFQVGGAEQMIRAPYLLACDGGRSAARALVGESFPGISMQGEYLADCDIDWQERHWDPDDDQFGHNYLGGPSMLVIGRLQSGPWRFIMSMQQDDPRMTREFPGLEQLASWANAEHKGVKVALSNPRWQSAFFISARIVKRMRHGRIFLVGDAAHIHSPVGGQGMNMGVQDATNLAWKIGLAMKGEAGEALLDTYHAERYPIIEALLESTTRAEHVLMARTALGQALRNRAIALATRLTATRRFLRELMAGYKVNYRASSLNGPDARRGFKGGPRPGDLAPDALGLYRRLQGDLRFQLITYAMTKDGAARLAYMIAVLADCSAVLATLEIGRLPGTSALVDEDGEMARRYGIRSDVLILLRPDGYVAGRASLADPADLFALMARLLPARRDQLARAAATLAAS